MPLCGSDSGNDQGDAPMCSPGRPAKGRELEIAEPCHGHGRRDYRGGEKHVSQYCMIYD